MPNIFFSRVLIKLTKKYFRVVGVPVKVKKKDVSQKLGS